MKLFSNDSLLNLGILKLATAIIYNQLRKVKMMVVVREREFRESRAGGLERGREKQKLKERGEREKERGERERI